MEPRWVRQKRIEATVAALEKYELTGVPLTHA